MHIEDTRIDAHSLCKDTQIDAHRQFRAAHRAREPNSLGAREGVCTEYEVFGLFCGDIGLFCREM